MDTNCFYTYPDRTMPGREWTLRHLPELWKIYYI